jgi:hypothetical protein
MGTEDGFCLRMVAQVSSLFSAFKGVILRGAIMLYPTSAESLSEVFKSTYPGIPGLKIAEAGGLLPTQPKAYLSVEVSSATFPAAGCAIPRERRGAVY